MVGLNEKRAAKPSGRTKTGPIDLCTSGTSTNLWLRLRRSCAQYLNFAAVLRSRRRASKSGCDLTTRIIDSIAAIITPGSISPSVHSRKGSRGVGKLSQLASSQVADTSLDLAERSGSTILRNNRPQFGIFKISIRGPKKTDYVLPVGVVHIDTDAELLSLIHI